MNRQRIVSLSWCSSAILLSLLAGCQKRPPVAPSSPLPRAPQVASVPTASPGAPTPTVTLSADPGTIERGDQTTLRWSSTGASSLVIDAGIGNVAEKGELVATPLESTTYTAIASGAGGEARASTRVTVVLRSSNPDIIATDIDNLAQAIEQGRIRPVFFEYDQATLSEESRRVLEENARLFRQFPGVSVIIEGHCDERGTEEYNLALGDRRAQVTKDYLVAQGVDGDRLVTVSYGEERPFVQGYDESAWRLNRRAHFQVDRY